MTTPLQGQYSPVARKDLSDTTQTSSYSSRLYQRLSCGDAPNRCFQNVKDRLEWVCQPLPPLSQQQARDLYFLTGLLGFAGFGYGTITFPITLSRDSTGGFEDFIYPFATCAMYTVSLGALLGMRKIYKAPRTTDVTPVSTTPKITEKASQTRDPSTTDVTPAPTAPEMSETPPQGEDP